ncbi:sensor histidine kinase [Viridibacillus sp. FSL R5-0477]|uniref:histidine kinase n=1 Tax=Viridibacillus arenosi FSL R5-213 TaxID=1227360 RepID=W4F978_9BACL|nr:MULTISPECIES: sensor histidine kinase [Viridibacillus]ETT88671.1 sensor protein [Viridibacillus arenosi FSL R5-213]OMC81217.1 ATP-binding protein [Viridibacillus sp. FSL H8-0123]OMC85030.1 ATP-binding protein [Viridibacillus sp. FSL H7-0596]OMC90279.1 ATP-binding protein [Viridibacillus arenosi]
MFLIFLKERRSWILFFIVIQLWLNLVLFLDVGLSSVSAVYLNLTNTVLFIVFLMWRYLKETKSIRRLKHFLGNDLDIESVLPARSEKLSSFETVFFDVIENVEVIRQEQINNVHVEFSEDKDRALGWIHEVKTPLTAMKLLIDSLEENNLKKRLEIEWLRIHLLLDQELHHIRLSSIENDNRIEIISIRQTILREIKNLQTWCIEKGIGFDIQNLDAEVLTDQKWTSFIIRQLLSNAVKYSNDNSDIQIYASKDLDGHVYLYIKDSGIGISQADLPRIFNKSFTGEIGRHQTASTGMGLYLAKNAASKLGIQIFVQSEENVGTVFSLRFPLKNEFVKIMSR